MLKYLALRWANRIRKEMGLPPRRALPRGFRSEAGACPLATALGPQARVYPSIGSLHWRASVAKVGRPKLTGTGTVLCSVSQERYRLPFLVGLFASRFDRGKYPELRKPGSPLKAKMGYALTAKPGALPRLDESAYPPDATALPVAAALDSARVRDDERELVPV